MGIEHGPIHVTDVLSVTDLPAQCVDDCTGPGPADEAVTHWRKQLSFTVDAAQARQCLAGYGAWDEADLASWEPERLAETVLWLACGDFSEWDGTEDSPAGSDICVLEG